jgi:RNA polymerase sigma-70 factor (ECF subfamily)
MNRVTTEQEHAQGCGNPDSDGDDLKLIELIRANDRIAFDRLVVKYRDRIVTLCVRTIGNFQEGEDAAQETFVKVYENIGRFKGDASFSTWLYRIAINTCRNHGRSWWGRVWRTAYHLDKSTTDDEGKEQQRELSDTRMLPTKDLERTTQAAAINAAIGKLPAIHRELVVLRDVQGKSYEEIEAITGLAEGTVKSRLARAREALQQELKGLYYER